MKKRDPDIVWEINYAELSKFIRANGGFDRASLRKKNPKLCAWLDSQIADRDKLTAYQKEKLKAIGLTWGKGESSEEQWLKMFEALKHYKKIFRSVIVRKHRDAKLFRWVQWNKSNKANLTEDQLKKLEELGVNWYREAYAKLWDKRFEELKDFKNRHGHLNVKKSDGIKLYAWVLAQRNAVKKGIISTDKLKKLTDIGLTRN